MANVPPRDTWLATGDGLMRWRPVFDRIEVQDVPGGKLIRLCLAGNAGEILLDQAQADSLADRLRVRP